jgi:signal transduction histidine kinase
MVVLAFLVPLALLVRTIAEDRALNAAELEAQSLAPVIGVIDQPEDVTSIIQGFNETSPRPVTVFLPDGKVIGDPAPADPSVDLARRGRAFSADAASGRQVLQPVLRADGDTVVIRVSVPDRLLRKGVTETWALLGALGFGLVALAVLVNRGLARSLVQPIDALVDTAHALGQGNLEARVEPDGPREIVEVGQAFNRLAVRIRDLLALEREAVADLSHRLRTPITALRLDADSVRSDEDRARLVADVDELERAVDRLIRDARRPVREGVGAISDAAAATRARVAFWAALAEEQARPFDLDVPDEPRMVAVHSDDLEAALDALLGNVFAHTPDGTRFRVAVEHGNDSTVRVVVEDEGPGFEDPTLVQRGISGAGSTGLGLDIVRRTAEAAGGGLVLGSRDGGGARIEMNLAAAPSPR